jgi:hypothetical protein
MLISKITSCIIRGTQTLFAAVIIALIGNMISNSGYNMIEPIGGYSSDRNHPSGGNPAEVNYAMFLGVWTLLSMALFVPLTLSPKSEERYLIATTALDGLTALFYMCDAIALAAAMGIHNCNNQDYILQNQITNNAMNRGMRCREAQAAATFIWLNFLLFVSTTVISARTIYWNSNPKDDIEGSPDSSEFSGGGLAVSDAPLQPRMSGMSRLWGHKATPSTGGTEVVEGGNEASVSGMTRFWGHRTVPTTGGSQVVDGEVEDSHNWRTQRGLSVGSGIVPEVDDGHSYRS